jgi:hypothetical protein
MILKVFCTLFGTIVFVNKLLMMMNLYLFLSICVLDPENKISWTVGKKLVILVLKGLELGSPSWRSKKKSTVKLFG